MLLSLMLVAALTFGPQAPTDRGGLVVLSRLRAVDPSMRAMIDEGCRRSLVFAELVEVVEQSNFIVYVEAVPALRNGMKGALLHSTSGEQYLRIHLRHDLAQDLQVAVLAHELQHVREVVQAGISANAAEMEFLYRRIGGARLSGGRRQQFETAAAKRVGDSVAADLRSKREGDRGGSCRAGRQ